MPELVDWILADALLTVVLALAGVLALRARARRVLGTLVHARPGGRARQRILLGLAIGLALLGLRFEPGIAFPCALLLAGSGALLWLTPSPGEGVCGDRGLRFEWDAFAFSELSEWRLTGDHLRFRGDDEWSAVELPRSLQAGVRSQLEQICSERVSAFRN